MHNIPTMNEVHTPAYGTLGEPITVLHPAASATEKERIIAFWTVYAMHNCWGVALGMQANEAARFTESFAPLGDCMVRFITALSNIITLEMTLLESIRSIFVTHTLAHTASLRLNAILADAKEQSRDKCLAAALAIVGLTKEVDIQDFQQINPIIGTFWVSACQFLIGEVSRLRTLRPIWGTESMSDEKEKELFAALEQCFGAMVIFSLDCPLISYQLTKIQHDFSRLN
ncbi:hypothetical protein DXG03_000438 [Asterophora parasitica]|uniref:Transcription factor domain-containing protein n=1 Tax=Asterophora parasitica TaxID=117018 RepID=A0A9P7KFZ8_9AGAR|nr:hypothetical protein DXG03_000438 [Asterophora parasitica]